MLVLAASGTTTYSYDAAGNLAGYAYPNGVNTGYGYDNLNRLTSMQRAARSPPAAVLQTRRLLLTRIRSDPQAIGNQWQS